MTVTATRPFDQHTALELLGTAKFTAGTFEGKNVVNITPHYLRMTLGNDFEEKIAPVKLGTAQIGDRQVYALDIEGLEAMTANQVKTGRSV